MESVPWMMGRAAATALRIAKALLGHESPPGGISLCLSLKEKAVIEGLATRCCMLAAAAERFGALVLPQKYASVAWALLSSFQKSFIC